MSLSAASQWFSWAAMQRAGMIKWVICAYAPVESSRCIVGGC